MRGVRPFGHPPGRLVAATALIVAALSAACQGLSAPTTPTAVAVVTTPAAAAATASATGAPALPTSVAAAPPTSLATARPAVPSVAVVSMSPALSPSPPLSPSPSAVLTPADLPSAELARVLANPPPKRDLHELARRFRLGPGTPVPTAAATAQPAALGDTRQFWVADSLRKRYFQARARLVERSAHVDFWVQEGETVDPPAVARSLATFEDVILPGIARDFGGSALPLDRLRVSILNARLAGLVGYYSSLDEYPTWVAPFSNELPLIVMSLQTVRPGTRVYDSGLAHEFQHLVQWRLDPADETWVNEGTAELAIRAVGLDPSGNYQSFLERPNVQLNHWAEHIGETSVHYGAADLFFQYLTGRYGGYDVVGDVLGRPERGIAGIEPVLRRRAGSATFQEVYLDWLIANWANQPAAEARYGYPDQPGLRVRSESLAAVPTRIVDSVRQFGGRYYELPAGAAGMTLIVEATPTVPLVAAPASTRPFWWSGRGDSAHSQLYRTVDLRGAPSTVTLQFHVWYDLERDYDYAYATVSRDSGATWTTLPASSTTSTDPNGANLGAGFTGKSGGDGGWISQMVDLSPYVGQLIEIGFEMVTDDAYNGGGFCVDAIEIPEIGWRDTSTMAGWRAEGFTRISNAAPQRMTAQVVTVRGEDVRVTRLAVDADGRAALHLPRDLDSAERMAVILGAHTPLTIEPAPFSLTLGR